MRSVLLIGKGPSAEHADAETRCGEPIAVINDAMKLVTPRIEYCFFIDVEQVAAAREHAQRVRHWVCPRKLHKNCRESNERVPSWIHEHGSLIKYPYERCDPPQFEKRVKARKVCMHSSACAAMSWLAYQGFDRIRLIGFDGGAANAKGVNPGIPPGFNYDGFRKSQQQLAKVLTDVMGVKVQWLC